MRHEQSPHPIVIIGAGRSGTNMLRDILTQLPGFGTWPCDEINYIWRHGNVHIQTDAIPASAATASVKRYIQTAFAKIAKNQQVSHVVEKTCANSLRVPFIDQVLPNAKYLYIVRDGRDVVASADKRWVAELDLKYILRKARYVPLLDLPYYAVRYLWSRVYRVFSKEKRLAFWGPRFEGMEAILKSGQYSLPEICALQWQHCVRASDQAFEALSASRVHYVRYEDFVQHPIAELQKICAFLNVPLDQGTAEKITSRVSSGSMGKWRQELQGDVLCKVNQIVSATLKKHGYD